MALNFPSNPTTDQTVDLNGVTYIFDGVKWTSIPLDNINTQEFVLSAGDTNVQVPGGYVPGNIVVSLNGAILGDADYTATDGVFISLTLIAANNDLLRIFSVKNGFTFGNTYTKAEQDTRYLSKTSPVFSGTVLPDANGVYNIGTSGTRWDVVYANVFNGVATEAKYADLAEIYLSDEIYTPGTVVEFGGVKEITSTTEKGSKKVIGVVSDNPAYLMNSAAEGIPVALQGRVYCYVKGPIEPGELLISSNIAGAAERSLDYIGGAVIGKSISKKTTSEIELIEIFVSPA